MGQRYNKKAKTGGCVFQKVGKLGGFGKCMVNKRLHGNSIDKFPCSLSVFKIYQFPMGIRLP